LRFSSDDLASYLSWLKRQISSTSSEWLTASTSALMIILRVEANREAVIRMGIVEQLLDILKRKCGGFQLQYQIICCFWLISFSCANELLKREVTVPTCDVLRETEKQKVSRVCLALFRNLLEKGQDRSGRDIAAAMISCKIQKSLQVLQDKTLDDSEMEEDLAQVYAKLQEVEQSLSSYEEFCSEVTSGRLSWSPVHTNNRFWRENAQRLVEKDYFVLRRLTHILETDQNSESLSVGCHDLGEFVRYYPRGRQVIDKIAAKQTVMQLMTHEDQTVRYNALIAVQKMMVNNWEILGRQIAAN
jgi:V-type H+-transporting ATPase subunit H